MSIARERITPGWYWAHPTNSPREIQIVLAVQSRNADNGIGVLLAGERESQFAEGWIFLRRLPQMRGRA